LDLSATQVVCTPADKPADKVANLLASFERQIHSFMFMNDHSGYEGMKARRYVYRGVLTGQMWRA